MDKVRKKTSGLSIQKSLILIFSIVVCVISIFSGIAIYFASMAQQDIARERSFTVMAAEENSYQVDGNGNLHFTLDPDHMEWAPLTAEQRVKYIGSYTAMIGIPVLLIIFGISLTSIVYYRKKLRKPIMELKNGIVNIQNNNLDFTISYNHPDELGDLCCSMEKMRSELRTNNKRMWEVLEERKRLNASVAHDLRTPITVLKGYLDYLNRSIRKDQLTRDSEMETIRYMQEATGRLERYVDCIRDVESIENLEVSLAEVDTEHMIDEIKSNMKQLEQQSGKAIRINTDFTNNRMMIDKQMVFRILENLIQNALRYAKQCVTVTLSFEKDTLMITVADDGEGFSKEAQQRAGTPFFRGDKDQTHFGLGLYICRTLCEKQNGQLSVFNSPDGGAVVRAFIKISEFFS